MSVISHHSVNIRYEQNPLVTEAFGGWCMDHLNTQWLAGDENVHLAILQILTHRLEKKPDLEQFVSSPLLSSLLVYLQSPSSLYFSEVCSVLTKAAVKETARHRLVSLNLLAVLNVPHLFESRSAPTRQAVFGLLERLSEYPDAVGAVYDADYLLPSFNTLVAEETVVRNKICLMNLLANLVFNASEEVSLFSDRFFNLGNLAGGEGESHTEAWLRLVTAVASRSDAGKLVTLDAMEKVLRILKAGNTQGVRVLGCGYLATATVLKEARFAFRELGGLEVLRQVFEVEDNAEEVERYAAQTVTALAEWPTARAEMQTLRPALERRRTRGRVFQRAADQLAWTP